MLELRLLGPVEALVDGMPLPVGTPKQQAVLAMLALRTGSVVGVSELIDELWPEEPPASAVANVRTYAANLRRAFEKAAPGERLLVRRGAGYQLLARPEDVDLNLFLTETQRAAEARDRRALDIAAKWISDAQARWRGPVLAGVPRGPALAARCEAAEEERLRLVELQAELHLAAAHPEAASTVLRDHVRMYPLRERGHALLIRALHASNDAAGALAAYATARSALVDQLGIEPGEELRRLQRAVLNRDQAEDSHLLSGRANSEASSARATPVDSPTPTCWLPRLVADFTGRRDPVCRMVNLVEQIDSVAPVVQVIDGMAGSGKTTLAIHLATRLAERYPDAQLFIDLQGHSSDSSVQPATALVTLLRQLGVAAARIPAEFEHRVALWRSELARRRTVIVLDNAGSSDQLIPLLPTAPGTVVLVTSRRRLMASDGVPPYSLPVFDEDEAIDLLANVVGHDRVRAEPDAAVKVVRACGHLPLAIRLAGARLAHRPGWRVADLARRLDQDAPALAELAVEDRTVAGAFSLSYQPLTEPVQRMFRLLGLYPGEFFQATTAAALCGQPLAEAEAAIAELVDRHLAEEPAAGRYRLHDLTRQYALDLTIATDPPAQRGEAVAQVLDLYLHAAARVTEPFESPQQRRHLNMRPPGRPDLLDALDPLDNDWLEAQRTNITRLIQAAASEHPAYAWRLARATWRFHHIRGYFDDILVANDIGLRAAQRSGDLLAASAMHNYIASAYVRTAQYQAALDHLESAIAIRSEIGDEDDHKSSLGNLSVVYHRLGRLHESVTINRSLAREKRGIERFHGVLPNLANSLMLLGAHDEALRLNRLHLWISRIAKQPYAIAQAMGNIAEVRVRQGHHSYAIRLLTTSLRLRARTGNRYAEAETLNCLGVAYRGIGELDEAEQRHQAAIVAAIAAGENDVEAAARNDLGLTLRAAGRPDAALDSHRHALALATRISHPYEQGRALAAIGDLRHPDAPAEARGYWRRALAIFARMDVPERDDVERRLTAQPRRPGQPKIPAGQGALRICAGTAVGREVTG